MKLTLLPKTLVFTSFACDFYRNTDSRPKNLLRMPRHTHPSINLASLRLLTRRKHYEPRSRFSRHGSPAEKQTDGRTDRQTDIAKERQTDRDQNGQRQTQTDTDETTDRLINRGTGRQTDRPTQTQTDRETDREIGTDRQTWSWIPNTRRLHQ